MKELTESELFLLNETIKRRKRRREELCKERKDVSKVKGIDPELAKYITEKFHRNSIIVYNPKRLGQVAVFIVTRYPGTYMESTKEVEGKILASFYHQGGSGYIIKRVSDGKIVQMQSRIGYVK